jgi:hypothetical protein
MPTITPGVTPISFSDWDNLYNVLLAIIGPIAVDNTGKPLSSARGNGYGLNTSFLNSAPYPFSKTISTISRTNPAVVSTGSVRHGFQNGDIVFLSGLPGAWANSSLEGQYFEVTNALDTSFALRDTFLTSAGLPTYPSNNGTVSQPIVHKSQFDRIKLDVDAVFQHIFATNSSTTAPTRNTTIQGSVYNQYYTAIDQALAKKLVLRTFEKELIVTRSQTGTWGDGNAGLDAVFTVTFPDELKFFQFWNTGGLIVFGLTVLNEQTSGQQAAKEISWDTLCTTHFPMYYGGFTKSVMGYNSTTFAPDRTSDTNNWSDEGAFTSSTAGFSEIYRKSPDGGAYASNYISMEHRRVTGNPAQIQFNLFMQDQVVNAFTGGVTADVRLDIFFIYSKTPIPLGWNPSTDITISFTNNI